MKGRFEGPKFCRELANVVCSSPALTNVTLYWDCRLNDEFFKTLAAWDKYLTVSSDFLSTLVRQI